MSDKSTEEVKEEIQFQTISDFLESTPPNQTIHISGIAKVHKGHYSYGHEMLTPEIQLHCNNDQCNGTRFFRCVSEESKDLRADNFKYFYMTYQCSNCQSVKKIFSLAAKVEKNGADYGQCYKFGEWPTYGPPVSPKLVKLIGPDKDEFLKGRRCENQGLGVGAFIYYRRVVENQKDRIFGEIIKVSEKIDASEENIKKLNIAVSETQFTKALEIAKDAIPESLLINGHSPILLLHSALSEGVHALTDEQCLEMAGSVRVVLGELSDRLSQALKDDVELKKALSTLMNKNKKS